MAETIKQGSIEFMLVDVTDQLHNLTSLTGTSPVYDVLNATNASMVSNASATSVGLTAYCLIDTTSPSLWAAGNYRLYLTVSTPPETPRLGPFQFTVDAS